MAKIDSIDHIGLSLKDVYLRKRTGQLHFSQEGIQKYLYFENGELVHARTNQPEELLGEVLFRQGKINEDVYRRIDEFIEPHKSIGQILIENNLITRADLREGLANQMREITLNIFPNFLGQSSFREKEGLSEETFDVRLEVPALIEDGIRRMKYDDKLRALMSATIPSPGNREFYFHLTEDEKEIYAALAGDSDAESILGDFKFRPELYWRSLFLFYCLDLITVRPAAGKPASSETPSPDATKSSAPESDPAADLPQATRDVIEFARQLDSLNYFQLLDVAEDVSPGDVKKAYFQMARKYHPDLFDRDLSKEFRDKIEGVFDRITKAYHTLSDSEARDEYKSRLREKTSGGGRRQVLKAAEVKFRQSKTLYDQARYKEAVILLEEAVRMNADKSSYFLLLALSQSKLPEYHRQAVKSFRRAIELEPWGVDGHLGLGIFYKREGMPVMAAKHFKRALAIDPDNRIARKELAEIEPPSKGTSLKDLLSGDLGGLFKKKRK